MECATHPEITAAGICTRCDKPICAECTQERGGRAFCAECATFLDARSSQRPAAPRPAAAAVPEDGGFGAQAASFSPSTPELGLSPSAGGDLYGSPSLQGEVYGSPPPAGDVYGGDVYRGDIYSGQADPGGGVGMSATEPATESGVGYLVRGLVYGLGAGLVGVMIWYGVVVLTDTKLGLVAIGVGSLAGFGVATGAKRQDMTVATIAALIAVVSMLLGDYMSWEHFIYGEGGVEAEYREMVMEIGADHHVSRSEMARYIAWGEDFGPEDVDLAQYSKEEIADIRKILLEDYETYRSGDRPEQHGGLSLELFVTLLKSSPMSFLFFLIGAGAAFKIGRGGDGS